MDGFPNLEIVCRDGSTTYRKAISDSNKNIIQVSDRFHLLKNLTEYTSLQQYEVHELPKIREKYKYKTKWELILAVQKMRADGDTISQISEVFRMGGRAITSYCKVAPEDKEKYDEVPIVKKSITTKNQELKADIILNVHKMLADGYSKQKIAEAIGKSERTVRRYLTADPSRQHGKSVSNRWSKLDPYKDEILKLSAKGQSSLKFSTTSKKAVILGGLTH